MISAILPFMSNNIKKYWKSKQRGHNGIYTNSLKKEHFQSEKCE